MNAIKRYVCALLLLAVGCFTVARPARAEVTDNFRSQTSFVLYDAYHHEEILVVTDFHAVMKQIDNLDGSFTTRLNVNAHGVAIGLTSGTQYVFNDRVNNVQTTSSTTFIESLHQRSHCTSPGSADNVVIRYDLVYRVEAGVLTVDLLNQFTESRG